MIRGIGIDSVEVSRFADWHNHQHAQLRKILSAQEIVYCLAIKDKSAERFAVRFAAREAFYKAFSHTFPAHELPFLTICKALTIEKLASGALQINVNWQQIQMQEHAHVNTHISVTHTQTTATAIIIIS